MTLRLTIDGERWHASVARVRASYADAGVSIAPVVKGNGYGIGRQALTELALGWSDLVVVGTVHEAQQHHRIGDERVVALTPPVRPVDLPEWVVPTVGRPEHLAAVAGRRGPVAVKLRSSMHRYGVDAAGFDRLLRAVVDQGATVHAAMLHLPLVDPATVDPSSGDPSATETDPFAGRLAEVDAWLERVPPDLMVSVSHLDAAAVETLRRRHPDRRIEVRLGTALWHGERSSLHLRADVIDTHRVTAGRRVGYRAARVPDDGTLVIVGAGSAHGVVAFDDGRSPFHLDRQRLALVEPPHMHTSMCFVPSGRRAPVVGEWVDVQRPLTTVAVDEVVWS